MQKKTRKKLEKGSPFYPENRIDEKWLRNDKRTQLIYQAIDLFKEGLNKSMVESILKEEDKRLSDSVLNLIIIEAKNIIDDEYSKQSETIIGLHLTRYDNEINDLFNRDFSMLDIRSVRKVQVATWMSILDTMFQKEKLLGLHNKKLIVRFNQKNTTIVKSTNERYDLSKLTLQEKVDFLSLINKAKKDSNELFGVLSNRKSEDQIVEDIQHEEIDQPNISKIEQIQPEVEPDPPTNTALIDVTTKLALALKKKAQEEFTKAGSKTVREDGKRNL